MKKIISILLSVCFVMLCFCGCGSKKSEKAPEKAPEKVSNKVIDDVLTELENVESVHIELKNDSEMNMGGQDVSTVSSASCDVDVKNSIQHLSMDMSVGGQSSKIEGYFVIDESSADVYIQSMGMWLKQTGINETDVKKLGLSVDAYDLMSDYVRCLKDAGEFTEKEDCYILSGKIDVAKEGILEKIGLGNIVEQLAQSNISADKINEIVANSGSISMSITIDKKSLLPSKIELDMSEVVQNLMDGLAKELGQQAGVIKVKRNISVSQYSNYNKIEKIEIPEEALNAKETSLVQ